MYPPPHVDLSNYLNEYVDFAVLVLHPPLHIQRAILAPQRYQLHLLLLPHRNVLELGGVRHHVDHLAVAHLLLQHLVISLHGRVVDVEMAGHPAQLCDIEVTRLLVEPHHLRAIQRTRRLRDQKLAAGNQTRIQRQLALPIPPPPHTHTRKKSRTAV